MEKTKITAQAASPESAPQALPSDETILRPLSDWELVMAGGGETSPDW